MPLIHHFCPVSSVLTFVISESFKARSQQTFTAQRSYHSHGIQSVPFQRLQYSATNVHNFYLLMTRMQILPFFLVIANFEFKVVILHKHKAPSGYYHLC